MKAPSLPKVAPPPLPPLAPTSANSLPRIGQSLLTTPPVQKAQTQRRTLLGGN